MKPHPTLYILMAIVLASCRHISPTGNSSYTVVDDIGALKSAPVDASKLKVTASMSVLVVPKPIPPLVMPEYPSSALAAHLLDVQFAVTLVIDKEGRVITIEPSLARLPYTNAFREEFVTAIEQAVKTWRFEPGKLAHLEPQPDGRPLVTGLEDVDSKLTIAFNFARSGKVLSEINKP
jgi:hypothetical protein